MYFQKTIDPYTIAIADFTAYFLPVEIEGKCGFISANLRDLMSPRPN